MAPPSVATALHKVERPEPEPTPIEELEQQLSVARARVRQLAAAVEAEEGTLVHASLAEAEEKAAAEHGAGRPAGPRPTEERLRARVAQAEKLLRKEHVKFQGLLADDNVRLALAVEQGVSSYYDDVQTVRRRGNPAHGPVPHTLAQAGTALKKLQAERARLADVVRSLSEEQEALAAEARVAAQSKDTIVDALRRRDALRAARDVPGAYPY